MDPIERLDSLPEEITQTFHPDFVFGHTRQNPAFSIEECYL